MKQTTRQTLSQSFTVFNTTRCCSKPMCTECYFQVQTEDEDKECPFCKHPKVKVKAAGLELPGSGKGEAGGSKSQRSLSSTSSSPVEIQQSQPPRSVSGGGGSVGGSPSSGEHQFGDSLANYNRSRTSSTDSDLSVSGSPAVMSKEDRKRIEDEMKVRGVCGSIVLPFVVLTPHCSQRQQASIRRSNPLPRSPPTRSNSSAPSQRTQSIGSIMRALQTGNTSGLDELVVLEAAVMLSLHENQQGRGGVGRSASDPVPRDLLSALMGGREEERRRQEEFNGSENLSEEQQMERAIALSLAESEGGEGGDEEKSDGGEMETGTGTETQPGATTTMVQEQEQEITEPIHTTTLLEENKDNPDNRPLREQPPASLAARLAAGTANSSSGPQTPTRTPIHPPAPNNPPLSLASPVAPLSPARMNSDKGEGSRSPLLKPMVVPNNTPAVAVGSSFPPNLKDEYEEGENEEGGEGGVESQLLEKVKAKEDKEPEKEEQVEVEVEVEVVKEEKEEEEEILNISDADDGNKPDENTDEERDEEEETFRLSPTTIPPEPPPTPDLGHPLE
ncbi:hypothetical protein TL16_g02031 [Triparma laevis f. inornata]|uniref:RING-type domain-containing protein n=1 Tax=Triparma laevis f. inornata TaxID=1714386 RepID=A0A9W6ZK04_9STRA|nr:hypothetical protein TL16_g02031 [Triparma laevis f. inornata]